MGLTLLRMDEKTYKGGINSFIVAKARATPSHEGGVCRPPATRKLRDWRKVARNWMQENGHTPPRPARRSPAAKRSQKGKKERNSPKRISPKRIAVPAPATHGLDSKISMAAMENCTILFDPPSRLAASDLQRMTAGRNIRKRSLVTAGFDERAACRVKREVCTLYL